MNAGLKEISKVSLISLKFGRISNGAARFMLLCHSPESGRVLRTTESLEATENENRQNWASLLVFLAAARKSLARSTERAQVQDVSESLGMTDS